MPGAAQPIPTIELIGPAGLRVVNASEHAEWRERGYTIADEKAEAAFQQQQQMLADKAKAEQKASRAPKAPKPE